MNLTQTDIVILGAGIGGYETFRTLAAEFKRKGIQKKITIVDQNNYFTFVPLMHEVAAGAVEPSQAAVPLRELTHNVPHDFIMGTVQKIDPEKNIVHTSMGDIRYEYCVLAIGSETNYYGIAGAAEHSYTVRSLKQAMELREAIVEKLEGCDTHISLSVVGGGYTGVEVAGQLQHLLAHDVKKLYPEKKVTLRILQVEKTLVPSMPANIQTMITNRLRKMGVEVLTESAVKEVRSDSLVLASGATLPSTITVWCAGFKSSAQNYLPEKACERGRMLTTAHLTSAAYENIYGVGDIIVGRNVGSDVIYPQLGEAAHRQGEYVGRHIAARIVGKQLPPFYFKSFGTLMPIGDGYGIVKIGPILLHGWIAWWIRRTVYVLFMPGILRKLKIVINWTLRLFGFSYILEVKK